MIFTGVMQKNKRLLVAFTVIVSLVILISVYFLFNSSPAKVKTQEVKIEKPEPKKNEFGLIIDSLQETTGTIKRNETLSSILAGYNVSGKTIYTLSKISKKTFDLRKINYGKPYFIYAAAKDNNLRYFVYQEDPVNYIVMDFKDSVNIYRGSKKVTVKRKTATGVINHSLYASLTNNDADPELVEKLAEVYAWQIDFYRIQKGDEFKVIYNEEYVDDQPVGIGKIIGAYFKHDGENFYAIDFKVNNAAHFYDENGKSLRKAFLKAPLKFSRISSHYTKRRFHPIQKRFKAHLGTDYAAATGTPIHTVGDGVIIAATYTKYNGNYVKVRHNSTYTTQYLHMSKIARGMKPGVHVKQGDVIGFVGSTGLATGPHLCFRFWKNGKQVDPFKQKIPSAAPLDNKYLEDFNKQKDIIISELDSLQLPDKMIASKQNEEINNS